MLKENGVFMLNKVKDSWKNRMSSARVEISIHVSMCIDYFRNDNVVTGHITKETIIISEINFE